jgi:hypothetical protein
MVESHPWYFGDMEKGKEPGQRTVLRVGPAALACPHDRPDDWEIELRDFRDNGKTWSTSKKSIITCASATIGEAFPNPFFPV